VWDDVARSIWLESLCDRVSRDSPAGRTALLFFSLSLAERPPLSLLGYKHKPLFHRFTMALRDTISNYTLTD